MSEAFDPYLQWLGIRDPQRPPNHYRLLGVDVFESDADVLTHAADRQMAHVRTFQSGKHSAASQRLLNELAAAKICLLNEERKAAYDESLRVAGPPINGGLANEVTPPPVEPPLPPPVPLVPPPVQEAASTASSMPPMPAVGPELLIAVVPDEAPDEVPAPAIRPTPPSSPGLSTPAKLAASAILMVGGLIALVLIGNQASDDPAGANRAGHQTASASTTKTMPTIKTPAPQPPGPETPTPQPPPPQPPSPVDPVVPVGPTVPDPVPPLPVAPGPTDPVVPDPVVPDPVVPDPVVPDPGIPGPNDPAPEPSAPEPQPKHPVPSEAACRATLANVLRLFAEDYGRARRVGEYGNLSQMLYNKALATDDDPVACYVLLTEARDQAVAGGVATCFDKALEAIGQQYAVDTLVMATATLQRATTGARSPAANKELAQMAMKRIDDALARDDYQRAKTLAVAARDLARRMEVRDRDLALTRRAAERMAEVDARHQQYLEFLAAFQTLLRQPDDPQANLTVGRFYCLVKQDFDRGLPNLAKGSDTTLARLARAETPTPQQPGEMVALADRWYDAAKVAAAADRAGMRARAAYWYDKAEPGLSGMTRDTAQHRLREIELDPAGEGI